MSISQERLQAWFDGDLEDEDLTKAEVKELERLVFDAALRKATSIPGAYILPDNGTIQ